MRLFINDAFVPRDKKTLLIQFIKNFQTNKMSHTPKTPKTPKRVRLSLEQRQEICESSFKFGFNRLETAGKFGVTYQCICEIVKNRHKILQQCDRLRSKNGKNLKSFRKSKFEDEENILYEWFLKQHKRGLPMSGELLKTKMSELVGNDHQTSDGWLSNFKKRFNIQFRKFQGESVSADHKEAKAFINGRLQELKKKFPPERRWNCDEAGLYIRCMPDKGFVPGELKNSNAGAKLPKTRISTLVACNEVGVKRRLLVIGTAKNPRGFPKDHKNLPCDYDFSKKAWMNGLIWTRWLKQLDREFRLRGEHHLMLVDNCPAHCPVELTNITLEFLPANTTSLIQPCDGGIIKCLKGHYRRLLAQRINSYMEAEDNVNASDLTKRIKVIDALHLLKAAWDLVTPETIRNCWKKCFDYEFSPPTPNEVLDEVEIPEGFDPQTFLAQVDVEPEDWDLILEEEDDDEEMEMEPEPTTKDPTELLKMVHVLRNDLQSRDGTTSEMLVTLESIERQYVKEVQAKKNLQPKITSFFKQNNNQNSVNNN